MYEGTYVMVSSECIEELNRKLDGLIESLGERPSEGLMDADQAADYLHMTTNSLYIMVREGKIPHLKAGRRYLFKRETLEQWAKEEATVNG